MHPLAFFHRDRGAAKQAITLLMGQSHRALTDPRILPPQTLIDGQNSCDFDSHVGWVSVSVTQRNLSW
ncbi:MAG: hypothetical protein EA367_20160 [Leptolyngbya sp. DLM2.Bin15]|nr:MAG: hypothetical protein EA367_20160 [Leptolyngbya sp. DLM2.Bin15]